MTDPTPGLLDEAAETTTHTEPVDVGWTLVAYYQSYEGQTWPAKLVDGWLIPDQAIRVPAGSTVYACEDGNVRSYCYCGVATTVHGLEIAYGQVR